MKIFNLSQLNTDTAIKNPILRNSELLHSNLKDVFESMGEEYLLPSQVWSNKKITNTIEELKGEMFSLIQKQKLTRAKLDFMIKKKVPELKGKLFVKNFDQLEKEYNKAFYDENIANCSAITIPEDSKVNFYLRFRKQKSANPLIKVSFLDDIMHDLTHVLDIVFKNNFRIQSYKKLVNPKYNDDEYQLLFNKLQSMYPFKDKKIVNIKITQNNMLKSLGYTSIDALHLGIENNLNMLLKQNAHENCFQLSNKKELKDFYSSLKNMANEEKRAYSTRAVFRMVATKDAPTNAELKPLLYEQLEKFFFKKKLDVYDDMHKSRGQK